MAPRLRRGLLVVSATVALGVLAEVFLRVSLGLGTPPLYVTHPRIEYLLKKNQKLRRLGRDFETNDFSMRSGPLPTQSARDVRRVLVFGDSVINGGAITDQAALATEVARTEMAKSGLNYFVGNISAGSWGPGNWLAYLEQFGCLEADAIIIVASAHDVVDIPTFEPLNQDTHPTKPFSSAIEELTIRYLPRLWGGGRPEQVMVTNFDDAKVVAQGMGIYRGLLHKAKSCTPKVALLLHPESSEMKSGVRHIGADLTEEMCKEEGVLFFDLRDAYSNALSRGVVIYRDNIHPNERGQRIIGEAIVEMHRLLAKQ